MKRLIFASIFGVLFGFITAKFILIIFPDLMPIVRTEMPFSTMIEIFVKNSFLLLLICFGGIVFSLLEIRVYKSTRFYGTLDKFFNPLYSFLKLFSKDYRKLDPMYRSCYFSIFAFPTVCIFLYSFMISLYFSTFLLILGTGYLMMLLKFLPHIFLEFLVFFISAYMALRMGEGLKNYLLRKNIKKYEYKAKLFLRDRKKWRNLIFLCFLLFIAAILEKTFVEM